MNKCHVGICKGREGVVYVYNVTSFPFIDFIQLNQKLFFSDGMPSIKGVILYEGQDHEDNPLSYTNRLKSISHLCI